MSINDILNDDSFIPICMVIFVVIALIAFPIGFSRAKQTNKSIFGDDESGTPTERKKVKILARRTSPHPLNQTIIINMVVFEFENGNRLELAIKDATTYGTMIEGDIGFLSYQGKKFISFRRISDNET